MISVTRNEVLATRQDALGQGCPTIDLLDMVQKFDFPWNEETAELSQIYNHDSQQMHLLVQWALKEGDADERRTLRA